MFALGPENVFLQSQKVPIIAIIIDINHFSMERDMKESNPSECSRKNLEYMYKLLISNCSPLPGGGPWIAGPYSYPSGAYRYDLVCEKITQFILMKNNTFGYKYKHT